MDPRPNVKRIVVIGGGIGGLAATHRLIELGDEQQIPLNVTLLEASHRLGGVIHTTRQDGSLIEAGPDSFITNKPWALQLSQRLGIQNQLIQTNEHHRRALVVRRGKLQPIPPGFQMIAPLRWWPMVTSSLFSPAGKMRMAIEPLVAPRHDQADESLSSFVTRRFGRQLLDRLVQPLVGGIYTANPDTLSVRATLPEIFEMEAKHGSIVRGMVRRARDASTESGARYSLFVTFRDGMETLVRALVDRIGTQRLSTHSRVQRIEHASNTWTIILENDRQIQADGLLIAVQAHQAARMLAKLDPLLSTDLSTIDYASSAVVHLAYRRRDIAHPLNAFGFVVPAIEQRKILACSFSSIKYAHRTQADHVLLRCFLGGAMQPHLLDLDDDSLTSTAQNELRDLLGINAPPEMTLVHRWPAAMPQYKIGHLELIESVRHKLQCWRGLELAGNAYTGVGIPDCIHSGEQAAERLVAAI